MNESRAQAYLELIQQLLSCPEGEESQILAENMQLLDHGFLQACQALAEILTQQGEENLANFLRNLVAPLRQRMRESSASTIEIFQFLIQVLQTTSESDGNPQVVYPLLAANLEKLNLTLAQVLRGWATQKLPIVESTQAYGIASVIGNFSNLIDQFPLGSKANNVEIAIVGYEVALRVFTYSVVPKDWAITQNNLGLAYVERIIGKKAQNIESAIACFRKALKVRTQSAFPKDWATTQNNLGLAYVDRIIGERSQNIESAIACFKKALKVRTQLAFPQDWAATQNNLGIAYYFRIIGKKAQNIESAIACFRKALKVRTQLTFPQDWAATQNNLGLAYVERIIGEKATNIENAIAYFTDALQVRTQSALPQDWATTQNNLGITYRNRIIGERAANIEAAIAYFTAALQVYTQSAFPQDWAATQNNLGNAYRDRIIGQKAQNIESAILCFSAVLPVYTQSAFPQDWATTQNNLGLAYVERVIGEKAANIESAIACYTAALQVRTQSAFPQEWAGTQNNLGNAYSERIIGEKAANIESAIACYTAALQVYTQSAFPQDWAMTQNNLGNAYSERVIGEKAANIESAIACYTAALQVRTQFAFPQNYTETLFNLGLAYQNIRQIDQAYQTFAAAIETVEFLRSEIDSGDESKQKLAEEWNQLYRQMVEVCLELGKYTEAIEYVERSKARNLVELLALRDLYPKGEIPPQVQTQLQRLRQEIAVEKRRQATETNPDTTHLNHLREEYNRLFPFQPIDYPDIQKLLDDRTAILEWYLLGDGFLTFVMTADPPLTPPCQGGEPNSEPSLIRETGQINEETNSKPPIIRGAGGIKVLQFPETNLDALIDWLNNYLRAYLTNKTEWQNSLASRLEELAQILHLNEILACLPPTVEQLVLIPHRFLHLFPLHALQGTWKKLNTNTQEVEVTGYLLDLFDDGVKYAPSCQLLQQAQTRQRIEFDYLFGIQTPTEDLHEADLGVFTAIKKQFTQAHILKKHQAKKSTLLPRNEKTQQVIQHEKLLEAHCTFFFCHGFFDFNSPLNSGLELADDILTLADIINHFDLQNCRLVTLSACETGLTDFTKNSDEYIGLPSGFLLAGTTNVVSTLWSVSADATALFMTKFFEALEQQDNLTIALKTTQIWLRETTVQGFQDWLKCSKLNEVWKDELNQDFSKIEEEKGETAKIFESPYYWAAFCIIGKGGK